jgi:hypothetical protein
MSVLNSPSDIYIWCEDGEDSIPCPKPTYISYIMRGCPQHLFGLILRLIQVSELLKSIMGKEKFFHACVFKLQIP